MKEWRRKERLAGRLDDDGKEENSLSHYESLIGYERPSEPFRVGKSIRYIRDLKSVTSGAKDRWETILLHNKHDLLAMRDVMFKVTGIEAVR